MALRSPSGAVPRDPSKSADADDDLDLPPLDGEDVDEAPAGHEELDEPEPTGDALDDATGEDAPIELDADGAETTWLADSEEATGLDVGGFDVGLGAEEKILEDDEPVGGADDDDLGGEGERVTADGGEEGPLADDEELREEDLPALDADEDGDVSDDELYDRAMLNAEEELRWDDRAWERASAVGDAADGDDVDESGTLAVPGDDASQTARDATWRVLDETGRVSAAVFVPGGSVVLALASPDRARASLVRVQPDGRARIIAEIDFGDREDAVVSHLRWDATRGCLVASGAFGSEAFRPV